MPWISGHSLIDTVRLHYEWRTEEALGIFVTSIPWWIHKIKAAYVVHMWRVQWQKHLLCPQGVSFLFLLFPNPPNLVPCTVKVGSVGLKFVLAVILYNNLQSKVKVRNTGQAFGSLNLYHPWCYFHCILLGQRWKNIIKRTIDVRSSKSVGCR